MNDILEKRKSWYQTFVILEMVKCLQHHETAFITAKEEKKSRLNIRYLFSERMDYLNMHFKATNFFNRNLNIYKSLASFLPNKIPIFSYNLGKRLEEPAYKDFNENYQKYCENYSFLIDFDCKEYINYADALKDAKKIKEILDEFNLPFSLCASSFKGFHFHIEGRFFPKDNRKDWLKKRLMLFQEIAYNLQGIYNIKGIDLSIFDAKRIHALPYSMKGDGAVVLPLSDEQFNNFKPEMVSSDYVLKNVFIKNRGLLIRNLDLSEEQLRENVAKFVKEFK
jgi:hypothetical protein